MLTLTLTHFVQYYDNFDSINVVSIVFFINNMNNNFFMTKLSYSFFHFVLFKYFSNFQ